MGGGATAGGAARARAAERVAERRGGEAEVRGRPELRGLHIQGLPAQSGPGRNYTTIFTFLSSHKNFLMRMLQITEFLNVEW